jgi:MFS family permease
MFFAGWTTSAFVLPRTADIYGRRKVYLLAMTAHLLIYIGELFSRNIKLTTALQFFFGTMSVGRATIGYLLTLELVPEDSQATVGTMLQFCSSSVTVLACIYFYFISKYWLWF